MPGRPTTARGSTRSASSTAPRWPASSCKCRTTTCRSSSVRCSPLCIVPADDPARPPHCSCAVGGAAELPLVVPCRWGAVSRRSWRVRIGAGLASLRVRHRRRRPAICRRRSWSTWGHSSSPAAGVQVRAGRRRTDRGRRRADSTSESLHGQLGPSRQVCRAAASWWQASSFALPSDRGRADRLLARDAGRSPARRIGCCWTMATSCPARSPRSNDATVRLTLPIAGPVRSLAVDKLAAVLFNPSLVDEPQGDGLRAMVGLSRRQPRCWPLTLVD